MKTLFGMSPEQSFKGNIAVVTKAGGGVRWTIAYELVLPRFAGVADIGIRPMQKTS